MKGFSCWASLIRKCWRQFEPESRRILRSSALKATLLSPVFHLLLHPRAICVCAWLNLKRLGPKSEQSGDFVTEVIFTGFPSERDGSRKFWMVDAHNTKTGMRYSLGSFTDLEEAVPVSGIDYKDQAWRSDWWAYDAEKSIDLAVLLHYPRLLSGLSFIGSLVPAPATLNASC